MRLTASKRGWGRRLSLLTVTADNADTVRARRAVVVRSAGIRARLSPPRRAALDRGLLRYRVTLKNTSTTTAWDVKVAVRLPRRAVIGRSATTKRFAAIAPGETKRFVVTFRVNPRSKGKARAQLKVRTANARAVARGHSTTLG